MSLDAIVWLVAGIGLGVGLSLLLLMFYAGLERLRLRRRIKRARVLSMTPTPREERATTSKKPVAAVSMIKPKAGEKTRRIEPTAPGSGSTKVVPMARNENVAKRAEPVVHPEPVAIEAPTRLVGLDISRELAAAVQEVQAKTEAMPETTAETSTSIEVQQEPKPEPEAEPKLEPESQPEPNAEPMPEPKADPLPQVKPEPVPESEVEQAPKVEPLEVEAPVVIAPKPVVEAKPVVRPSELQSRRKAIADVDAVNQVEGASRPALRTVAKPVTVPAGVPPSPEVKQVEASKPETTPEAERPEEPRPETSNVDVPRPEPAEAVETKPAPVAPPVTPADVKPPHKSVEALFAEAFARDPLTKPDNNGGDKP